MCQSSGNVLEKAEELLGSLNIKLESLITHLSMADFIQMETISSEIQRSLLKNNLLFHQSLQNRHIAEPL
jgi:hypothetical protein